MPRLWSISAITSMCLGCLSVASGQIAGPNVNMVSGTKWPGGDPNLQKQNEPSIAVSTRNPLHLVAGGNDYRTVDFAGLPFANEEGVNHDAWLGLFKSYDGGQSWQSTLLPGCSFTPKPGEAKNFNGIPPITCQTRTRAVFILCPPKIPG